MRKLIVVSLLSFLFVFTACIKQTPEQSATNNISDKNNNVIVPNDMQKETPDKKQDVKNVLDLSGQGLSKVPEYVFGMTSLRELNLSNNILEGALPGEIRFLKNLEKLDVSKNNMTGIPAEIGQLDKLESLNYSSNGITGLPLEIGNLKNLKEFDLSSNDYSEYDLGLIKKELSNLNVITD